MNPIEITKQLQETLVNYLTTTFDVNRDGKEAELAQELQESFALDGALFNGPYLEINLPYKTGITLKHLVQTGVLSPKLLHLDCFNEGEPIPPTAPLYFHQEMAIRQLSSEKANIVVSSGTGSGKTECFLIPILNDLLVDPTPGVRAVIIYPMNALVNDQLDRLRTLLKGTSITFGRYTGELEQTRQEALKNRSQEPLANEIICRDDIQKEGKLPQILITNYAMLEYLLLRPEDAPLFQQGLWKYLVLDEAHTYAGAQGIEVGLLIRRLKHRLQLSPHSIQCIATSATLTSDSAEEASTFAQNLFDETFTEENIIFGYIDPDYVPDAGNQFSIPPQSYLHPEFDQLIEEIRKLDCQTENIALRMAEIGLITLDMLALAEDKNPLRFLWEVLKQCNDINKLRQLLVQNSSPISVAKVAEQFFEGKFAETPEKLQALYRLIELGAMARPEPNKPSLLPAKYHLFARPPHGIWVCVNPNCAGKKNQVTGWSRIFASKRETCDICGCSVYPLTICRTCGQTYLRMMEENGKLLPEVTDVYTAPAKRYLTWSPIFVNRALAEIDDEEEIISQEDTGTTFDQREEIVCLHCNSFISSCSCGTEAILVHLHLVVKQEESKSKTVKSRPVPLAFMNECARCHDREFNDEEIAREISMATTNPLSIVTSELYRLLPVATKLEVREKPGNGRKLLTFYDSRQGAARFAAFLSDIVSQEVYRHLIPTSISNLYSKNRYWPDIREVSLQCVRLGWEARIYHNDPETDIPQAAKKLSSPQQNQLAEFVQKHLISEITTRRRVRRSLESIGLVGIQYFESNNLPDFSRLAQNIGLSPVQTRILVEYLLDGLRNAKIITLPDGVNFDDEVFGRNKFHPAIIREGKTSKYEVAWIGATDRQMRRRLVQKVLKGSGLPAQEEQVLATLNHIWEWLLDKNTDLMKGSPAGGYRLRHDRIFFETELDWYRCNQCRRLSCRGDALICPHPYCEGNLERVEIDRVQKQNYYHRSVKQPLVPMRIEEHTAQLNQDKGRNYQEAFKAGDVNVLSCSTTFEMGIDLGDLQAIVLSNIPPTVANYKQRAGRAGRRTSGAAFILAWASERPHDQTFFNEPSDIIGGKVRVPHILLENPLITQRHINAIVLSAFLRYLKSGGVIDLSKVGAFFESSANGAPHTVALEQWLINESGTILEMLQRFSGMISPIYSDVEQWIVQFKSDIDQKAREPLIALISSYKNDLEKANRSYLESNFSSEGDLEIVKRVNDLLKRIREDHLINYLSDQGVLPSYSFPLHTVYLNVPNSSGLRLQRDLRQAIREYAPGQEVVADKRIWRSAGVDFKGQTPRVYQYRICEVCNHLQVATGPELPLPDPYGPCPVCKNKPTKRHRDVSYFLQPDGFKSDGKPGKPAGQYVARQPNLMRSALLPGENVHWQQMGELLQFSYDRRGTLLYVNEGIYGAGFNICTSCGLSLGKNVKKCSNKINGQVCGGNPRELNLGFQNNTDTLHIRFKESSVLPIPEAYQTSFWLSLLYALIQGASRALQIERRDIDGVLFPREYGETWQQTIVLYDNVPGGAGHVKRIWEEIEKVIDQALLIANCLDCAPETSCYHCLQDFNNQLYHSQLNRGEAARFLELVKASLTDVEGSVPGANQVIAVDNSRWLMQQVAQTQQKLVIVADEVSLRKPVGERKNWLDVLHDLLLAGCEVSIYLQSLPQPDNKQPESIIICNYLHLLLERGLNLFHVDTRPEWNIFIDPKSPMARAIQIPLSKPCYLDEHIGRGGLVTTINSTSVQLLNSAFSSRDAKLVTVDALKLPSSISVLEIENKASEFPYTEEKLFSKLFEDPIEEIFINDRYLLDEERLCNRVGSYIRLANKQNSLKKVVIHTWLAGERGTNRNTKIQQDDAIRKLRALFPQVMIEVKRSKDALHDRFLVLTRVSNTKARILIGQGLDFIKPDGSVKPTYITVEDPYGE